MVLSDDQWMNIGYERGIKEGYDAGYTARMKEELEKRLTGVYKKSSESNSCAR